MKDAKSKDHKLVCDIENDIFTQVTALYGGPSDEAIHMLSAVFRVMAARLSTSYGPQTMVQMVRDSMSYMKESDNEPLKKTKLKLVQ